MGRRRRRRGTERGTDQYLTLSYPMLQSDAWRSLSGPAVKVWLELRTRFNGGNNGRLHLSFETAAKLLGIGKSTIARAYRELEHKGFLVKIQAGHWYGRKATTWRVTDKGTHGEAPTYDWKRWKPTDSGPKPDPKKQSLSPDTEHNDTSTAPQQDRGAGICAASEPVSAANDPAMSSQAGRSYDHRLQPTQAPASEAPRDQAIANSSLGLPRTPPGGSAPFAKHSVTSYVSAPLPIGPATEAARAEKVKAAAMLTREPGKVIGSESN